MHVQKPQAVINLLFLRNSNSWWHILHTDLAVCSCSTWSVLRGCCPMALWSLWVSLRKSGFEVSSSQLSSKQQISNFSLLTEAIEWRRSIRFIARREMSINGSMSPPPSSFPTPHSPATPLKTQESLQWKRFDCLPNFFHFTVHWSLKDQPASRTDGQKDGRTDGHSFLFVLFAISSKLCLGWWLFCLCCCCCRCDEWLHAGLIAENCNYFRPSLFFWMN